jgi:Nucleoside-diphosphate-sugar pyrophosphorylase involved in lipopolysaccharide biosynthesis/translation initiation factor 2B, gamma/epsilon subunits (eIF-2Bgamma/eIF-2Bepsilon)
MDQQGNVQIESPVRKENSRILGMILAGGSGKRLMPITADIPKPLVELKPGYTVMDKQLMDMKNAGISKVVILAGHRSEKIIARYGDSWNNISIRYSVDKGVQRGTWGAIKDAIGEMGLSGPAVIMNGDVVTDIPIAEVIKKDGNPVTILGIPMVSQYGIIDISGDRVSKFLEKPILPYSISGGIYYVKDLAQLMDYGKTLEDSQNSIEYDIFPRIAADSKLGVYKEDNINEFLWKSIDSIKDLEEVQRLYRTRTDKPWGYELLVANTSHYLQKKLFIKKNYRTSMHYHDKKMETLHIVYGKVKLDLEEGKHEILNQGDSRTIMPKEVHSIMALETTLIDESSTPYLEDTIRVKDFYEAR